MGTIQITKWETSKEDIISNDLIVQAKRHTFSDQNSMFVGFHIPPEDNEVFEIYVTNNENTYSANTHNRFRYNVLCTNKSDLIDLFKRADNFKKYIKERLKENVCNILKIIDNVDINTFINLFPSYFGNNYELSKMLTNNNPEIVIGHNNIEIGVYNITGVIIRTMLYMLYYRVICEDRLGKDIIESTQSPTTYNIDNNRIYDNNRFIPIIKEMGIYDDNRFIAIIKEMGIGESPSVKMVDSIQGNYYQTLKLPDSLKSDDIVQMYNSATALILFRNKNKNISNIDKTIIAKEFVKKIESLAKRFNIDREKNKREIRVSFKQYVRVTLNKETIKRLDDNKLCTSLLKARAFGGQVERLGNLFGRQIYYITMQDVRYVILSGEIVINNPNKEI